MTVKKKRVKSLIVALMVVLVVLSMVFKIKIEPASYYHKYQKQVQRGNELLRAAKEGNGNNEYASAYKVVFAGWMDTVNKLKLEGSYDDIKNRYLEAKGQNDWFVKSYNKHSLEKKEIEKIKKSGTSKKVTMKWDNQQEITWELIPKRLTEPMNWNPEAGTDGPYDGTIKKMLNGLGGYTKAITFYHNDKFPGSLKVTLQLPKKEFCKGLAYIYYFSPLDSSIRLCDTKELKEGKIEFYCCKGGTYLFSTAKLNEEKLESSNEGEKTNPEVDTKTDVKTDANAKVKVDEITNKKADGKAEGKIDTNTNEKKEVVQNKGKSAVADQGSATVSGNVAVAKSKVTLEIRCDTLSSDPSKLVDPSLTAYLPQNGTIYPQTSVEYSEGETVYDVLKRICRDNNIQMEASYTPLYESYYIEGINYFYEFHGGPLSGWMYKVNGIFPNYGCSAYKLKNGDQIVWMYTCDLGKDVGNVWTGE